LPTRPWQVVPGLVTDLAGFEKPLHQWFASWWLSNVSTADAGRPVLWPEAAGYTVAIVDSWTPPPSGSLNRSITVYTSAPLLRLWRNGELIGQVAVPYRGVASFPSVPFEAGNLTAEALDESGLRLGTHTALTAGAAARIRLSLDAPSPRTGTGTALVADGQDVAMVRAELLDRSGLLVSPRDASANATVTFSVVSGDGRILGTINGSPFDFPISYPKVDMTGPTYPAHYGLVRCFVRSTRLCLDGLSAADYAVLKAAHPDAGHDGSSRVDGAGCSETGADEIIVQASAEGLPVATLRIPLTRDPAALPLAVAAETAHAGRKG